MTSWICTKEFVNLKPVNFFHKEHEIFDYEPDEKLANKHVLFRKKFNIDKRGKYTIDITADDYYKLYINGQFVGQGPAPCYHFSYYYNTYDISEFLNDGENVIYVHVYYQGLINRVWQSGDNRMGLMCKIYCDGNEFLKTDDTWAYAYDKRFETEKEPIGYDTQFLEDIDMRKTTYDWENAIVKIDDDHVLKKTFIPAVSVYEMKPENSQKTNDGFVFDFGKEIVGGIKLQIEGTEGNRVHVMCAEELDENGLPRYKMRCNLEYKENWTLSGKKDIIENYDYKGFRYVWIKTNEKNFKPENLTAVVRHYPVKNKFEPDLKDETLQKIWDMCENGVIMGSQEGFLDCPTREKGQYLGDMTVTSISHSYITGDTSLYKKALYDFADSSKICKGLMAVSSCSFMQEIADFSLLYPYQLLKYYHLSGDKETLEKLLPVCENMLTHFDKYKRFDGLLDGVKDKWNLIDWPANLRDDYDFELTKPIGDGSHAMINAYYYGALKTADEIRKILGKEEKYESEKFKEAFLNAFMNKETGLIVDSEGSRHSSLHANVIPLFYKMFDEKEAQPVIEHLNKKGFCCGVFLSYFVLKSFANYGRKDLVYKFLTSDDENSWLNMIKEGASSCFEAWGKDKKANTSLCHPWASAPIILITEEILGINYHDGKKCIDLI